MKLQILSRLSAAAALVLIASCNGSSGSGTASCSKTATSVAECGGMNALVAAAKAEGQLNVIALPRDWVDYGAIFDGFRARYGIKINSDNPNGDSLDEVNSVEQLGTSSHAPDVLDLNTASAIANTNLFAPYRVATWGDIPDSQKEPTGLWTQDYGGYMSIGYDSSKVPTITAIDDLLGPAFRGKVALKGDPNQADAALYGVMMVNLSERGSLSDISTGVDFFHRLKAAGNFLGVIATQSTVIKGTTPVVFDWEYLSAPNFNSVPSWRVFVPSYPTLGSYFAQAINKNAPHPAAARLWEEYLYSDEGQNLWLQGDARPVRMAVMERAGKIHGLDALTLPLVDGQSITMTPAQVAAARTYLASHWSGATS